MEVHLSPDIQAKLDRLASDTGRPAEELIEDMMAGCFVELEQLRGTLDSRYDEIKSGKVKLVPGDEVLARLRAKSAARRSQPS